MKEYLECKKVWDSTYDEKFDEWKGAAKRLIIYSSSIYCLMLP